MTTNERIRKRNLGYALTFVILVLSYLAPVLAWYNSGLMWGGADLFFLSLLALHCTYIFWLKGFIFVPD
jgi:hypothetical protein